MTGWTRLPIRVRLTLTFAVGLALSLAALGAFVYVRTGAALLAAEDAGLSSRAEVVAAGVRAGGPALTRIEANLIERDESFAQIADSTGRILESSPNVSGGRLLPGWHADHVRPVKAGGATEPANGQALCPRCNLRKGGREA